MGTIQVKNRLIVSLSIIFGSMLAAAVALYFLVGEIDTTLAKIAANESLINTENGSLAEVASLKQQASQAAVYETAMNQLLPTQDGLIDFSQWISGIANQYQVTANITFQGNGGPAVLPSGASSGLGQMAFSLSASGTSDDLGAFLDDVESKAGGFLVSFQSFDLANSNDSYQLTAQGLVFFRQ